MKKKLWLKYGLIGFSISILHHIILLIIQDSNLFLVRFYDLEFYIFCNTFKFGAGEPCGWAILFWIPIVYTIIGVLIGILRGAMTKNE